MYVNFTRSAQENLTSIAYFIGQDSPLYANIVPAKIVSYCIKRFSEVPRMGKLIKTSPETREWVSKETFFYIVRYEIYGDDIFITKIYKWQDRSI